MLTLKKLLIICGHYGCGKTNLALNLAVDLADAGQQVTLIDLDLVNPYFRTADYTEFLQQRGIRVLAPQFANSNLDLPVIPPQLESALDGAGQIIIDVGGDDAGAVALGRFAARLSRREYDLLYVINHNRLLIREAGQATELLKNIEAASRLKATAVVNNTHLQQQTSAAMIAASAGYAAATAQKLNLPLLFHTVPSTLAQQTAQLMPDATLYPLQIYVKPPWE